MPKRSRKPPADENRAAKYVLDAIAKLTGETDGKDPAAVALGRKGGLKGGSGEDGCAYRRAAQGKCP